jgi:phage-related protein (TIGR01555 family)
LRASRASCNCDPMNENKDDGWLNVLSGLGTSRDKRKAASFSRNGIMRDRGELEDLYAADDIAARIVDALPDEMTREWIELQFPDSEIQKGVSQSLEVLDARAKVHTSLIWARLFGGSVILLGVDDGQTVDKPLNEDTIKALHFLTVLDRFSVEPGLPYADPFSPKFGKPEFYKVQPQMASSSGEDTRFGVVIHESRLLRFDSGIALTPRRAQENSTWSDSVLERVAELLPDFHSIYNGTAHIIQDFSQGVYKIKNLGNMLAAGADANVIKRLQMLDLSRSVVRAIVVDAEGEDFTRETASLAGLSDLMERWQTRLAAAARMPASIMMGQSPGGLNATGEMELRYWYDHVRSQQEAALRPQLEKLIRVMLKAKTGPTNGQEPESWTFYFKSLWQPSQAEETDARNKQANTDQIYIQSGVVTAEEIAASRFGGDRYSYETQIDEESRSAFEATPTVEEPSDVTAP